MRPQPRVLDTHSLSGSTSFLMPWSARRHFRLVHGRPLLQIANHFLRLRQACFVRADQLHQFSILFFRVYRHLHYD
jgi:hypothetical protein